MSIRVESVNKGDGDCKNIEADMARSATETQKKWLYDY